MQNVYICSSRCGEPDRVEFKFKRIRTRLEKLGVNPIDPLIHIDGQAFQERLAQRDDFIDRPMIKKYGNAKRRQYIESLYLSAVVAACDAIYLHLDWQEDINSIMEFMFAKMMGLPTLMIVDNELQEYDVYDVEFAYADEGGDGGESNLIDGETDEEDDYNYSDYVGEGSNNPEEKSEEDVEKLWQEGEELRDLIKFKEAEHTNDKSKKYDKYSKWFKRQMGVWRRNES